MTTLIIDAEDIINEFYESVDDINQMQSVKDILRNLPFEDYDYVYNFLALYR